ncbi:TRAP transporter solute receptor, TAXI family protein [Halalkalicoccus jeotgali B3]|uniref:TRAP transporter solute receptor, TAXI family protein n=1 Tax=Halalkalicoccus jeotgali (strain DSM 18796 / CECT 7217 / JCM 14584 / KCTC 4019 / B3) TaxID=795797 RepID=D8J4D4_HALJB|nr:TRAP transporter solute receptor, TAXI family protein [Halalkalicoccus jeotgali B3]
MLEGIGLAGIAGLAGCITSDDGGNGGNGGGGNGGGGGGGTELTWDAGGQGGTYYPLSNQFKQIVDGNTDYSLQVRSTGASVENIGNLAGGNADFALVQNDTAFFAYEGTGIEDFEGNAVPSLRGVATLYPETIHIVASAESGISSVEDLSGATINTGDLGSGTQVDAVQILEAVGITDYSEQNTGFSQAAEQLQNGDIDAAFIVGGWPVGAIENLATSTDITIVSIEGQARQQILDSGDYFAEDEIPAGTYSGVEEAVPTVAVQAMIATTEEQDEAIVEEILTTIFDNVDQLSIKQDFISRDTAQEGMSIPLHPGAESYFGSGGGSTNESGGNTSGNDSAENATGGNDTNSSA